MNMKMRAGKSSELIVAGELIRLGLDVFLPCVDDKAIDLIIRSEGDRNIIYYDIQVKSVKGYNRIIGVKSPVSQSENYILIIHYRHEDKPDEFFYLTKEEILERHIEGSNWGDLIFNKEHRAKCADHTLADLAINPNPSKIMLFF